MIELEGLFQAVIENPSLLFFLIILATFILEDPTTLLVGHLIATNEISFLVGVIPLFIGIVLGDVGLFFLGSFLGEKFLTKKGVKLRNINSFTTLFWARFIPGMRITFYPLAGHLKFPFFQFLGVNMLSSVIWTLMLLKGNELFVKNLPGSIQEHRWWALAFLILLFACGEYIVKRIISKRLKQKKSSL